MYRRNNKYTPAATMVAAWIKADIGVGPTMACGSQVKNGNWADLPKTPINKQMPITVLLSFSGNGPRLEIKPSFPDPRSINKPMNNIKSAILLVIKAILPAIAFLTSWNQKIINK